MRSLSLWLPETLAIIFSATSLAALAVLLAVTDGKAIFNWHNVTLNTIVSILSTASKASVLLALSESISQWKWILFGDKMRPLMDFERIDWASRGPLGSLKVLWHCKGAGVLRIGAITTIIALAVDPFAQQLVHYRQELVFSNNTDTTVARAQRYSQGNQIMMALMLDPSLDPPTPNTKADADFSMQSAVLYGLSQPLNSTVQQLKYNCPTGNCTWPSYQSLSVCSKCADLTSSLTQHADRGGQYWPLMEDNNAAAAGNGTSYRLPNGLFLDNLDGWQWGARPHYGAMFMTTYGTGNASATNAMTDLDTLIWAAGIIKTGPDAANATAAWPHMPVRATECALYYCVNAYETRVRNGSLAERASVVDGATRAADSWQTVDFPAAWDAYNDTMVASIDFDPYFSGARRSDLVLQAPNGERFNVSQNAVAGISAYFKTAFQAELQAYNETNGTVDGQINGWYMNSTTIQYQPSAIQPFWKSDDLDETFETLATSMTNALRADADVGDAAQVLGQSGRLVTYYSVQWPWIALNCVVVVMGAVFLVLTMRRCGDSAPVWKSSTLAAMSRGGHVKHLLERATSLGEMEKFAKGEKVVLFGKNGEVLMKASYKIMCQVFIAFSGGTMIIVQQVAVLAVSDDNSAASAFVILNVFGKMEGAVGSSIAGVIWTYTLPAALKRLLPESAKADWQEFYDSLDVQLSHEMGTPVRLATNLAYTEAHSKMLIAGTAVMALPLGWMFLVKDLKIAKQQTKGVLF
ncbi:hypothetical protein SLS58_010189 [Diplodia intermedia]|uniref:Uncharacterized protein n=1 Tax=Diplodia intermedia TaxID=856260 RepID=A0ABR3T7X5_9PEZI